VGGFIHNAQQGTESSLVWNWFLNRFEGYKNLRIWQGSKKLIATDFIKYCKPMVSNPNGITKVVEKRRREKERSANRARG